MAKKATIKRLFPFHLELLTMLAAGMSNKEIGDRLRFTESSIESYRTRLIGFANVRNTPQLISWAYQNGHLKLGDEVPPAMLINEARERLDRKWLAPDELINDRLSGYRIIKIAS